MIQSMRVLVTGATGRVGRGVADQLTAAGVPVRARTRRPEAAAELPANVEGVTGDLTVPVTQDSGWTISRVKRPRARSSSLETG